MCTLQAGHMYYGKSFQGIRGFLPAQGPLLITLNGKPVVQYLDDFEFIDVPCYDGYSYTMKGKDNLVVSVGHKYINGACGPPLDFIQQQDDIGLCLRGNETFRVIRDHQEDHHFYGVDAVLICEVDNTNHAC